MTSTRLRKLELYRNPLFRRVIDHKSQSVKRLTCCEILGSKISSGIKVSFEIIVGEILSNYSIIQRITTLFESF